MDANRSSFASLPVAPLSAPDHNHSHDDHEDGGYSFPSSRGDHSTVVDHTVPPQIEPRPTVEDRLSPTLDMAKREYMKYARRAKYTSMFVTAAMFSQVIISALVTGLAAAQGGRKIQLSVSALGALVTVISGVLIRIRATREQERSTTHSQNLEKIIRDLKAFILDEGYSTDRKWDHTVHAFRTEFEDLQTAAHQSEYGQPMTQEKPRVVHGVVVPKTRAGEIKLGDIQQSV